MLCHILKVVVTGQMLQEWQRQVAELADENDLPSAAAERQFISYQLYQQRGQGSNSNPNAQAVQATYTKLRASKGGARPGAPGGLVPLNKLVAKDKLSYANRGSGGSRRP